MNSIGYPVIIFRLEGDLNILFKFIIVVVFQQDNVCQEIRTNNNGRSSLASRKPYKSKIEKFIKKRNKFI